MSEVFAIGSCIREVASLTDSVHRAFQEVLIVRRPEAFFESRDSMWECALFHVRSQLSLKKGAIAQAFVGGTEVLHKTIKWVRHDSASSVVVFRPESETDSRLRAPASKF